MTKRRRHIFLSLLTTVGLLWLFVLYAQLTLPNAVELKNQNPSSTAFMDRYDGKAPKRYQWVSYSAISPYLKQAVVLAEDSSFFQHHGFDWQAIQEAFEKNWRKKEIVRGGSTITQQLAKNIYLSPSKNPIRKIKEILVTVQLEQYLSKQRILELYLNVVEWGEGIYGAEAAAQYYFNTNASRLSPYQAAWLASILPSPRHFQTHRDSEVLQRKAAMILGRLGF